MSDADPRELERTWRKTGALEDETAYLVERVRVGDLDEQKLELAACLGHEPAKLALGSFWPSLAESDLANSLQRLHRFGKESIVRTAVATAWPTLGTDPVRERVEARQRGVAGD